MEFLKGALVAGLWGCLVSLVLAFLFVAMTISFFSPAWDGRAFVRGMTLMPFVIGVWLVPISVFLGLLYVIIRRAVRLERGGSVAPGPSTPPAED